MSVSKNGVIFNPSSNYQLTICIRTFQIYIHLHMSDATQRKAIITGELRRILENWKGPGMTATNVATAIVSIGRGHALRPLINHGVVNAYLDGKHIRA